ncbi:MAG: hypothetical protein JSS81_11155 [Acidobacteria bacterium]|nr:hypothetical protein [Acidobacteriota bacterium]
MKNIIAKSFVGTLVVLFCGLAAFAQTPKRIDFAKEGSNSLVWEEKVAANSSKAFVFYAKKGQKLSLSMVDDTNQGSMDLGKISIEPNTDPFEMEIEVSKDYTLTVSNNSNKATSFRIGISLEDAGGPTAPSNASNSGNMIRVQFAKGETSTMLTKDIPANGTINFMINARKGQKMEYTVGYDFSDSDITAYLTEPGAADASLTSGPKEPQEFVVKKTGDHMLSVVNTSKKKVTITLYLDIPAAAATTVTGPSAPSSNDAVAGFYFPKTALPRGFAELEHLMLSTTDDDGNPGPLFGFLRPKKQSSNDYVLVKPKLSGKTLTFTTISIKGVSYSFTGAFTRTNFTDVPPNSNEVVLKGTLSRLVNGEAADETEVSFTYTIGD